MTQEILGEADHRSGSLIVAAAGVYDPEQQLNPEQVIELKQKFEKNYQLGPDVCAHIALGRILQREAAGLQAFDTREDFAFEVASLAAGWGRALAHILNLPGAEWPEGFSPPVTFAKAIKELEAEEGPENG